MSSSYSVLLYHRLSPRGRPGHERVVVPPRAFARQMRLLRLLRFHVLDEAELVAFHARATSLPARSVLVTFDDAFQEVVAPLARHADLGPLLFVPTAAAGGPARWLGDEPVAGWDELVALARGGIPLGGHSRTHPDLRALHDDELESEVGGAADDLEARVGRRPVSFAYPNGLHGPRERAAVARAGYALGFATTTGRNDATTDPFALHRVSVKAWDSRASFVWKALTGRQPPAPWERWLRVKDDARRRLARGLRARRAGA